ncbi:MAG: hypothetical protein IJ519_05785 [Clostridia bacterium]|nr:hypothetical protein [Clostridia bacterium]
MRKITSLLCIILSLCLLTGCNNEPQETSSPSNGLQVQIIEPKEKAPLTITVDVAEEDERYEYLQGYSVLKLGEVALTPSDIEATKVYPEPPVMEEVDMSWEDVTEHYGFDPTPSYLPEGLLTPAEVGRPQTWKFYHIAQPYDGWEVGDCYCDKVEMMYFEDFPQWFTSIDPQYWSPVYVYETRTTALPFNPVNRGVYITAKSSDNFFADSETDEEELSYYKGTPIKFYQVKRIPSEILYAEEGNEELYKPCMGADAQNTEEYNRLLEDFLDSYSKNLRKRQWEEEDLAAWNEYLTDNGMQTELLEPYYARFYYDGVYYTARSNLEFQTFAAVIASLIE